MEMRLANLSSFPLTNAYIFNSKPTQLAMISNVYKQLLRLVALTPVKYNLADEG